MEQAGARVLLGRLQSPQTADLKANLPLKAEPQRDTEPQPVIDSKLYTVQSELGKGSFGAVYLVQHKDTGKQYAMKVLDKAKYTTGFMLPYAIREKNVHNDIRHPCIVGLHHAFQTKTQLVMLLRYCPGGSLAGLLKSERCLSESLSRFYVAEVLLALGHLHKHRIVHRDVKPANVLLDQVRHALLTDFGLCKEEVIDNPNGLRSFAGSLHYLAPDVLKRTGHGRMVDVYNLGTLAFELMSGFIPFYTADKAQFHRNVKTAALRCPSDFSALAEDFVQATMAKEPEMRPGAADTKDVQAHAWFAHLDFDDVLDRKVDPPPLQTLQTRPSRARSQAKAIASPFTQDQKPGLPERRVEDWDFAGTSLNAPIASPQEAPSHRRSRVSCFFAPLQCVRAANIFSG
jgi:serine/threonine protein kinase